MKKVFAVFRVLTFPPYGWDFLKKIFSAGEKQAQSVVLHPVGNGKKAVPPAASAAVPNAPIHSERKYQFSGVPIRLDEWGRNGCMPFRKTQSTQTERHEVVISPHCSGTMGTPQYLILALLGRRYSLPFGTTRGRSLRMGSFTNKKERRAVPFYFILPSFCILPHRILCRRPRGRLWKSRKSLWRGSLYPPWLRCHSLFPSLRP